MILENFSLKAACAYFWRENWKNLSNVYHVNNSEKNAMQNKAYLCIYRVAWNFPRSCISQIADFSAFVGVNFCKSRGCSCLVFHVQYFHVTVHQGDVCFVYQNLLHMSPVVTIISEQKQGVISYAIWDGHVCVNQYLKLKFSNLNIWSNLF